MHPRSDRKTEEAALAGRFRAPRKPPPSERPSSPEFCPCKNCRWCRGKRSRPAASRAACELLVIERDHQTLEVLVEEIVPNHPLDAIAVGRAEIGRAFPRLGARRGDEIEQALPLPLVHVVPILGCAVSDSRDFLDRGLARLRICAGQWHSRHDNYERQQNPSSHLAYRVFSKISRPISMRRISLVPAPIS